jgi:hypothetical protein
MDATESPRHKSKKKPKKEKKTLEAGGGTF